MTLGLVPRGSPTLPADSSIGAFWGTMRISARPWDAALPIDGRLSDCLRRVLVQQAAGIGKMDLFKDLGGEFQAMQHRQRRLARSRMVIRVGNRAGAFPVALPQGPLAPVAADVMLARQVVARYQVGAEQEALRVAADQ